MDQRNVGQVGGEVLQNPNSLALCLPERDMVPEGRTANEQTALSATGRQRESESGSCNPLPTTSTLFHIRPHWARALRPCWAPTKTVPGEAAQEVGPVGVGREDCLQARPAPSRVGGFPKHRGKDDIVGNVSFYPSWYSDLADLDEVDWDMVYQRYWKEKVDDMDRQPRKQAEFLRSGTAWPRFRNMVGGCCA